MTPFDEAALDDEGVWSRFDDRLRDLAGAGARVRKESAESEEAMAEAVSRHTGWRPRAVIAAGPDSRLLRAVLEPACPVPFVAWPAPALPGWAGPLDVVVMLAPDGDDPGAAAAVAEGLRRGCQVVVATRTPSLVAEHAGGRDVSLLPVRTRDHLATAVLVLHFLDRVGLGPAADPHEIADALDQVAVACSPHRDLAVNPAKAMAISLADTTPLLWGGSVLSARAARRIAESMRRGPGIRAIAGDTEQVLPVIEAARPHDVFEDPFADPSVDGPIAREPRPVLVLLADGSEDDLARAHAGRLREAADRRGVRVETMDADHGSQVARYAGLLSHGTYAATYLQIGVAAG